MLEDGDRGVVVQRDKQTYAVAPHIPCGLVTPELLRRLADSAERFGVKALKIAYVPDSPVSLLRWVSLEELYRDFPLRSGANTPVVISRQGANFVFGPMAKDFTLTGIYYAKQDPLETTDPSWYVTNAPEVLLYGSLLEAAPFIHDDPRLMVWQQLFMDAVRTLREENDNAEVSKGQLIQRVS